METHLENGVVVAEVAATEDQTSIGKLNKAVPLTFAGIGCYSPAFFAGDLPENRRLSRYRSKRCMPACFMGNITAVIGRTWVHPKGWQYSTSG